MVEMGDAFSPDYAAAPGAVLREYLEVRGISDAEFAGLCGQPLDVVQGILAGETPVDPDTAQQFERLLGLAAYVWLGIEADYRGHLAREKARPGREVTAG